MNRIHKEPSLFGNIAALGVVQASNYVIPLLYLPYVTRVLGAESFGQVVFAQVLMAYVLLVVDYGFSWSATREVSANRASLVETSRIFMATWTAQWLLFIVCSMALASAVLLIERLRVDAWLYAAAALSVLGNLLFPVWFLQGLERLKAVALLQLLIRILALIPIFLLVNLPDHGLRVLAINGVVAILGGLVALYWMHRQHLVIWKIPAWSEVWAALRLGSSLFGSRVSISFYTNLVPLALGWIAGPVALAFFNVADKLRSAGQGLMGPVSQALYPRMSHLVNSDKLAAFVLLKRSAMANLVVAGTASLALWFLAEWLVVLLGGAEFVDAANTLKWLAPLPLVIGLSNILGVQIMLTKGMSRPFNVVLFMAAILGAVFVWPLIFWQGAIGAAQTMLVVELFVTLAMGLFLWKKGLLAASQWRNM